MAVWAAALRFVGLRILLAAGKARLVIFGERHGSLKRLLQVKIMIKYVKHIPDKVIKKLGQQESFNL